MHACFEVAIARENAGGNEIVLGDGFCQSGMKRAGIADTDLSGMIPVATLTLLSLRILLRDPTQLGK
jgi:hypothetical protein